MPGIIPDNFIQQLLAKIDIVDVIGLRLPLKKTGANFVTPCPFHQEKTPSFSVNRDKQFYYCFGCSKTGDAIQFLVDYENVSFVDAVETLASLAGLSIPKTTTNSSTHYRAVAKADKIKIERVYACLESAKQFYCKNLHKSNPQAKPAIEYLKNRGLTGNGAKHFALGFVPNSWDSLLNFLSKKFSEVEMLEAGLIIKNSNSSVGKRFRDRFRDRIIFPIQDRRGRTVGFGGRIVTSGEPKYLNSPETIVFNKSKELYGVFENRRDLSNSQNILVVEGYMDVISLRQVGINNAVATLGTALTEQHIKILFNLKDEIVFCFDGDGTGQKALWRAVELCLPILDGIKQVKFLVLPDNLDPDAYVLANGKEDFSNLVNRSMSIYDFIFYKLSLDLDIEHIDGKTSLVARVKPLINVINIDFIRDLLFERLAQLTGIDKGYLSKSTDSNKSYSYYQNISSQNRRQYSQSSIITHKPQQQISPAMRAAALLFMHRQLLKLVPNLDDLKNINVSGVKFFQSLSKVLKDKPNALESEIAENIPDDCVKHFNPKELQSLAAMVPEEVIEAEFCGNLEYLNKAKLNQGLDELLDLAKKGTLSEKEKLKLWEMVNASK